MASFCFTWTGVMFPIDSNPRHIEIELDLEYAHHRVSHAAQQLNAERDKPGARGFARVDVTDIYRDPRDKSRAFTVSYSDADAEMAQRLQTIVTALTRRAKRVVQLRQRPATVAERREAYNCLLCG